MIRDIREAFYETLMDLDWMDRVTKDTAMDKVSNLCAAISLLGYLRHCYVQGGKQGLRIIKLQRCIFHIFCNNQILRMTK